MKSSVSIIIPVYNNACILRQMLISLQYTVKQSESLEIVFVDDCSEENDVFNVISEFVSSSGYPAKLIKNERNYGFATSVNIASEHASGDILLVCNSDLIFIKGWYNPIVSMLGSNISIGAVGNIQIRTADKAIDHAGIFISEDGKVSHIKNVDDSQKSDNIFAFTGALFGIKKDVFHSLGGFDERYINGGEDIDLCLRIKSIGYDLGIVYDSVVEHYVGASRKCDVLRNEKNSFLLYARWEQEIKQACVSRWKIICPNLEKICARVGHDLCDKDCDYDFIVQMVACNYIDRELMRWRLMFGNEHTGVVVHESWSESNGDSLSLSIKVSASTALTNLYICGYSKKSCRIALSLDNISCKEFSVDKGNFNCGIINPISSCSCFHVISVMLSHARCARRGSVVFTHCIVNDVLVAFDSPVTQDGTGWFNAMFGRFRK